MSNPTAARLHSTLALSKEALIVGLHRDEDNLKIDKEYAAMYWLGANPNGDPSSSQYYFNKLNTVKGRIRSLKETITKKKDAIKLIKKMLKMIDHSEPQNVTVVYMGDEE